MKNKWHIYGLTDKNFKTDEQYIEAFKRFLKTNILPLLIFFTFQIFLSCKRDINKEIHTHEIYKKPNYDSIGNIDLNKALKRIHITNDGFGNNTDVQEDYLKEKESWLKEINIAYEKLHEKVVNDCPENVKNFENYHNQWKTYIDSKRNFEVDYIRSYYTSGEYIFQLMPYFTSEYESKLVEYYNSISIEVEL